MTDEFDDLLTDHDADLKRRIRAAGAGKQALKVTQFLEPVTINFLADVFKMDPPTVRRRLVKCPSIGEARNGKSLVYDFKTACEYLLKPKMDVDTFLSTLNPADMPNSVNKAYWEAKRIKLKFEIEAGQAWATDDVLQVFGDVFMTVKSHTQIWVESMRDLGLDDEQLKKVEQLTDAFNRDLYDRLVEMPKRRKTRSKIAELEREMVIQSTVEDGE